MNAKLEQKTFVIIDGNAIIHRAYHALPPLTAKDGTIVNAVYGFTSMLLKVMQDLQPTHIAVSFDVSGKTFRDDLYDQYKATRVKADQALYDQIPLVYQLVEVFDIPIYTKAGFEADDVIGTIAGKVSDQSAKIKCIIVTGDMDMLQLVSDHVSVYELRKGLADIVIFDAAKVRERYGFDPEQLVDYKALRGDPSDNIPGVHGIGDKTAKELIDKFGSIDALYKQLRQKRSGVISAIKPAVLKKLLAGEKVARLSYKLAAIHRNVPGLDFSLTACAAKTIDRDKIMPLFSRFGFASLLKRLPGEVAAAASATGNALIKKNKKPAFVRVDDTKAEEFFADVKGSEAWAVKELLAGQDIFTAKLDGLIVFLNSQIYYFDFNVISEKYRQKIYTLFQDKHQLLVGHDLKRLIKILALKGIQVSAPLFDVMVASYMLDSSTRAHDLRSLALRELGRELPAASSQSSLFGEGNPTIIAEELADIFLLYKKYSAALLERADAGLFEKTEMKLIPVLADMELSGVAIDKPLLQSLSKDMAKEIQRISKKIYLEAGVEFNIASSVQLRDVLFHTMGLSPEGIKKGKTGYSTAASELEKLRGLHPIIDLVEEHRELSKLQNTYVDVLPGLINKKTGRLHTTFNQTVAATGRLSSSDPNLQNIPIRTELGREIRNAFIAEPGHVLVTADYAQIELRIVASLAQDEKMMAIFKEGKDIHLATAAAINGVPLDKVTREMRYAAKEVNFGVLYGMGAYGLSWRTGISQSQAQEFIRKYFEQFSGVKKYIDQTVQFAKQAGYVETLFGRRRYIPELRSDNYQLRSAGERMAINMPIQGTQADLIKIAMIEVYEKLPKSGFTRNKVRMILQVHDELIFEVKKGLEQEVSALVKQIMEQVVELRVPIEVHVAAGKRWGELK